MTSQTRSSKRSHASMEPESPNSPRTSARKNRPSYKALQSTLPFAPIEPSQLSQVSMPRRPQSPELSTQDSTRETTPQSPTPSSRPSSSQATSKRDTIAGKNRVIFDIDFDRIGREFSYRKRTTRTVGSSRVSWIYLHGMELAKEKDDKHWICKLCYEAGKAKVLVATSTTSARKHLVTHGIYAPGARPPGSSADGTVDAYLEGVHPLQAERWREYFIDWIAHDDVTFEQAASPRLRKVILGGGSTIQHLLPSARTVRSWLVNTYYDRLKEVKKCLLRSRSKINLSFDA